MRNGDNSQDEAKNTAAEIKKLEEFLERYGYEKEAAKVQIQVKPLNTALMEQAPDATSRFFKGVGFLKASTKTAIVLHALDECLTRKDESEAWRSERISAILSADTVQLDPQGYEGILEMVYNSGNAAALKHCIKYFGSLGVEGEINEAHVMLINKIRDADISMLTDSQKIDYAIAVCELETDVLRFGARHFAHKCMETVRLAPTTLKDKPEFYKHVLPILYFNPLSKHPLVKMTAASGKGNGGWQLIDGVLSNEKFASSGKGKELLKEMITARVESKAFTHKAKVGNLAEALKILQDPVLNKSVFNAMIAVRGKLIDPTETQTTQFDNALSAIMEHKESAKAIYDARKDNPVELKKLLSQEALLEGNTTKSIGFLIYSALTTDAEKAEFLSNELVDPVAILLECNSNEMPKIADDLGVVGLLASYKSGFLANEDDEIAEYTSRIVKMCKSPALPKEVKTALANRVFFYMQAHVKEWNEDFCNVILPLVDHKHILDVGKKGSEWSVVARILSSEFGKTAEGKKLIKDIVLEKVNQKALVYDFIAESSALSDAVEMLQDKDFNVSVLNAIIGLREKFLSNHRGKKVHQDPLRTIFAHKESVQAIYVAAKDNPKELKKLLAYAPVGKSPISWMIYQKLTEAQRAEFLKNPLVDPVEVIGSSGLKIVTDSARRGQTDIELIGFAAKVMHSNSLSDREKAALTERFMPDHKHRNFFGNDGAVPSSLAVDLKTINNPALNIEVFKALVVMRQNFDMSKERGREYNRASDAALFHIFNDPATVEKLFDEYIVDEHKLGLLLKNKAITTGKSIAERSIAYYMYNGLQDPKRRQFLQHPLVKHVDIFLGLEKNAHAGFLGDYMSAISDSKQYTQAFQFAAHDLLYDGPYSMLGLVLQQKQFPRFVKHFVRDKHYTTKTFGEQLVKIQNSINSHTQDSAARHGLTNLLYTEIMKNPKSADMAKGMMEPVEHVVYMLATCSEKEREAIVDKLKPDIAEKVLTELIKNLNIDSTVKLGVLTIALSSSKEATKTAAISASKGAGIPVHLPENKGVVEEYVTLLVKTISAVVGSLVGKAPVLREDVRTEALKALITNGKDNPEVALNIMRNALPDDIVKALSSMDKVASAKAIDTMMTGSMSDDKERVNAILRSASKLVPALIGERKYTLEQKGQILLGFANAAKDKEVSKFLAENKDIDLRDPQSIKAVFPITKEDERVAIISLLINCTARTVLSKEDAKAYFEAGVAAFAFDAAAAQRFKVRYFENLEWQQDIALWLLGDQLGQILGAKYRQAPGYLNDELAEKVLEAQSLMKWSNDECIEKIKTAVAQSDGQMVRVITPEHEHNFIDRVVNAMLENANDKFAFLRDHLDLVIENSLGDKLNERIGSVAKGSTHEQRKVIAEKLAGALTGGNKDKALSCLISMLAIEEMRPVFKDEALMKKLVENLSIPQTGDFNKAISGITNDEDRKAIRTKLFEQLHAQNKNSTITDIANTSGNMKLGDMDINTALLLLGGYKHNKDVALTVINEMLYDGKPEDLQALLRACKADQELVSWIIEARATDPNISAAIEAKVGDEKNLTTYGDIYVLHSIAGLKYTTDAVAAAGMLLTAHAAAKDNPAYQAAIAKYYERYVGQIDQVVGERPDIASIEQADAKLLAKFFEPLPGARGVPSVQPDIEKLKPANLLLFKFDFLVKLNEAHKNPGVAEDPKGLIVGIAEWLRELFTSAKAKEDAAVAKFADNFEGAMSKTLEFKVVAAVQERHPDGVEEALKVDVNMAAKDAPAFAKAAFAKAVERRSIKPSEISTGVDTVQR